MSASNEHDTDFHDGFVGVSREDFEVMPDSELAQWEHNHRNEPPLVTLAEREWERRIISHQLSVQYDLDSRLAKAAEEHSEKIAESNRIHAETLAKSNQRWAFVATIVGVIGTLSGAWLSDRLSSSHQATSQQAQPQNGTPAALQPLAPGNSATSAASSTILQSEKKSK